jgi:hypothetical protein
MQWSLLNNVRLSRWHGRYSAISYYAGDYRQTAKVIIDGVAFNAFANLHQALSDVKMFLEREFPDKEHFV